MANLILGGGCFWCVEAVFQQLKGVKEVTSGYAGGSTPNPGYREVCTGRTGHAEVVNITYDPETISLADLLEVFWLTHDPTTKDRQGNDVGTQYRSIVFFQDETEQKVIEEKKAEMQRHFDAPIVTEVVPEATFYPAEVEHQDYYRLNGHNPYCQVMITPKLQKLVQKFSDKVKS